MAYRADAFGRRVGAKDDIPVRRIELGPGPAHPDPPVLVRGPGGRSARQGPYTERHSRPFPSRFFLPVQADLVERRRERRKNFPAFVSWSAVIAKIRSRCY